jgi:hypothetical protein
VLFVHSGDVEDPVRKQKEVEVVQRYAKVFTLIPYIKNKTLSNYKTNGCNGIGVPSCQRMVVLIPNKNESRKAN